MGDRIWGSDSFEGWIWGSKVSFLLFRGRVRNIRDGSGSDLHTVRCLVKLPVRAEGNSGASVFFGIRVEGFSRG